MDKYYTHTKFVSELKSKFPSLIEELEDSTWAGLLHLEMAVFARYTQKCVSLHNEETFKKCIAFIEQVITNCTEDVDNAIYVSYFEHLDLNKDNHWAYELLGSDLQKIYTTSQW